MPPGSTSQHSSLPYRPETPPGQGGVDAAFAELYGLHHQSLYRYCLSLLRHEHDAQDALQNTMIKAHAELADDRRDLQMRPWLFRVAHNECISAMRRCRQTSELADDLPAFATTEQRHAQREEVRQLERDLVELPERQRSALVLRELSGLSHEEIAAVLGATPSVVKSTIHEARSALLHFREGREMACDNVRGALSDGDRRVLRGGRQRAHLRDCAGCRAFQEGLLQRPIQLAAIAPPLPAAAATAMLEHVLGGAGAAGSAAAFSAGSTGLIAASASVAPVAVGGSSAAVTAAAAGTSILGGVGVKVVATLTVAALAAGGTVAATSAPTSAPDRAGSTRPAATQSVKRGPRVVRLAPTGERPSSTAAAGTAGGSSAESDAADPAGGAPSAAGSTASQSDPQTPAGAAPPRTRPSAQGDGSPATGATGSGGASDKPKGAKPPGPPPHGPPGTVPAAPGSVAAGHPSGSAPAGPGPNQPALPVPGPGPGGPNGAASPQAGTTPAADAGNGRGPHGGGPPPRDR